MKKKTVLLTGAALSALAITAGACGGSMDMNMVGTKTIANATPSVVRIEGNIGGGSGFVIDGTKGLIVTNNHVIAGNSGMKAQIGNDPSTTTPVRLLAADPCDDLAVVQMVTPLAGMKPLPMGMSSMLKSGDSVTVMGFPSASQTQNNPNDQTTGQANDVVTNTGIVSSSNVTAGPFTDEPTLRSTVQHQAPVNHGNSGGPLINDNGQVVGINTLTGSDTQGQYYSIASDYAMRILPSLEAGHSIGYLGWDLSQLSGYNDDADLQQQLLGIYDDSAFSGSASTLAANTAKYLETNHIQGVYDNADDPGSPADQPASGDALTGTLITAIDGIATPSVSAACSIIQSASPGSKLKLTLYNISAGNSAGDLSAELASNSVIGTGQPTSGPKAVFADTVTLPAN